MNTKTSTNSILGKIAKIWRAVFYIFSAIMLYAVIILCIYFALQFLGASGKAIDTTCLVFTGLVALYIVGKSYYVTSKWLKRRRNAELDELNDRRQKNADAPMLINKALPEQ